jgi:hypothetical protein
VAAEKPAELSKLGAGEEGFIYLPVRELKDKYQ